MLNKIKIKVKDLNKKGLFHIFGTSIINKILALSTNIFIVNLLSKSDYGLLGYSNNILNIFLLFSGLGLTNGILQFCSENRADEEKKGLYSFGFISGLFINFIIGLCILVFGIYGPINIQEARIYIVIFCFMPIVQYLFEYISIVLRTKRMNREYALIQNFNIFTYFILSMLGAYKFGIFGVIIGRYISFIITCILEIAILKDIRADIFNNIKISINVKIEILKYSFICSASNSISQLLYLLDIFFIGLIIANETSIASYQVATLIPNALLFIPINLMVFIYPYIAEKKDDIKWVRDKYFKLLKYLVIINSLIGIILFICAPIIINIIWGQDYLDSILPFRILSLSYIISATLRIPAGNILGMLRKVKVNLWISIISGISNIILDIVLIKLWGAVGAAIATILVVIISSIISVTYLSIYLCKKS